MTDTILDDVKALLDKEFGDDRILKQIYRACKNNEVISNYERNYVQKLAEKHLGRRPQTTVSTPPATPEKPIVPDVVIPDNLTSQNSQQLYRESTRTSSKSKNPKIMVGMGGAILAIIIVIAVSFTGITDTPAGTVENPANTVSATLSVQTDVSSYREMDLISISGVSNTSGVVTLSITNQNNELVWTEKVSIKSDGRYSTLAIAGGPGWENSGKYNISVDNEIETKSNEFSFTV